MGPGAPDEQFQPPAWLDRSEYPFAHRFASLRDGLMHYIDEGEGEPVLFSHGTPTWSFEYRHVIRAVSNHRRCIAPDHFGFGLSDRAAGILYTPEEHAKRFREFVEKLGLERFALVVHDFGGPIALPLALEGRVTRLVVMNSWMWPFDDDPEMARRARLASGRLGRWLYRNANASLKLVMPSAFGDRKRLTKHLHRHYLELFDQPDHRVLVLHTLARALLGSSRFYADLHRRAPALSTIPTLIIWGMKDSAVPPNQLARWRALLPHATVRELAEAGHWPHEEAPSEVAEAIDEFLAVT
jgi:haloalkane dehalogenase